MAHNSIRIKGTASVANVSCGFDCLGYAITDPGDILTISTINKRALDISISGFRSESIPTLPEKNTAGKAILSLLDELNSKQGFDIHIEKGIPPGSGIGSSAASAVAAVFGVNELLGNPLQLDELLVHAMAGEAVASGGFHADNVAPALFGGLILIRSYDPLDIVKIPVPKNIWSSVVLPDFSINTWDARNLLPTHIPLKIAVEQAGNLAGFTLGLTTKNLDLVGRSMVDLFAEPVREKLIPNFYAIKNAALESGAIGCGISGSGPSLFALSDSEDSARNIGLAMQNAFSDPGLQSQLYCSPISNQPPIILD